MLLIVIFLTKKKPFPSIGTLALQTHNGKEIQWRNFFVKEIKK